MKKMTKKNILNKLKEEFGEDWDLLDWDSEWDSNISDGENERILREKFIKPKMKEIKESLENPDLEEQQKQEYERFKQENPLYRDYKEMNEEFILNLFDKPKVIGIIGDVNSAKSMLAYNLVERLGKFSCNLKYYGFKANLGGERFYSLEELESFKDSIVFIDEFYNLFELNDRKKVKQIEKTLRLINHNNNILVLVGVAENFKKFISNKLDSVFFKKTTIGDCINGSRVKNILTNYSGFELGTTLLNLDIDKTLYFNGNYQKYKVDYLEGYDLKRLNKKLVNSRVKVRGCKKS